MDLTQAVDGGLNKVGGYRRWHLFMMSCLGISSYCTYSWQLLSIIFTGWYSDYHCSIPEGRKLNESIPFVKGTLSQCLVYVNSTSNVTTGCNNYHYNSEGYYTIVQEWDLVCGRDYYAELSQTLIQVGSMTGELVFAFMADRWGRKWVHIGCLVAVAVIGTIVGLSRSYIMFVTTRLFLMAPVMGASRTGETMYLELFGSKQRGLVGIMLQVYWTLSSIALGLFAYYITNWRDLQIFLSLPSLLVFIYIWMLPESVMWVVANGNLDKGEETLHKMAKWNGIPMAGRILPETLLYSMQNKKDDNKDDQIDKQPSNEIATSEQLDEYSSDETKDNENIEKHPLNGKPAVNPFADGGPLDKPGAPLDLIRNLILLKHSVIFSLMWFVECLVYNALVMSIPNLPGNRFVNYVISAAVELPGYLVAIYAVKKSRRLTLIIFHFLIAIFMITITFLPDETSGGTDLGLLKVTCAMLGKFGNAVTFAALVLYGKECFPTNLRNSGAGIYGAWGAIGNMVAPFMAYMIRKIAWLPYAILSGLCCITGLAVLLLPETSGKPLPQTIRDCYRLYDKYEKKALKTKSNDGVLDSETKSV